MTNFHPFIISVFLAISVVAAGDTGNIAYENSNYAEAAKAYESKIQEKGPNAALLYNLGNAYYRLGKYGPAIYAYERALLLDPRSPDIKANLELTRKAATAFDESNQPKPWLSFLYWLSYNEWLITGGLVLFILAALSLLRAFDVLKRSPVSLKGLVNSLVVFLVICIAAIIVRQPELHRAIVISEKAEVRLSPFQTAEVKATLRSGQVVQIEQQHEDYYRVNNGWVSRDAVKPLMER